MTHDIIASVSDGRFVVITEGTGDNLFQEDIDAGYIDYVNYEIYRTLEQARQNEDAWSLDGGMVYLKKAYSNLRMDELLTKMEDELGGVFLEFVENYEW